MREKQFQSELMKYSAYRMDEVYADPLEFYRNNRQHLPILTQLAKYFYCIPASSVPTERLFSQAGLTSHYLRNRLDPANLEMLTLIKGNL